MEVILDRIRTVMQFHSRSRSKIYLEMQDGTFPRPVKIGKMISVWPRHEHQAIAKARVEGKSDAEIRQIVAEIVKRRKEVAA